MLYIITFLEGIITFVSPCLLPMLPIYLTYLAGGETEKTTGKTILNSLGFILGFTIVFVSLGAFAGLLGSLLIRYATAVNIIAGLIVIVFGLNYLGVLKIGFLNKPRSAGTKAGKVTGFFTAVLFGVVFSVVWTPCVGMFLGAALVKAAQQASAIEGTLMLLCFSLGLGIPFFLSALLLDRLKAAFTWIKKHYKVINIVSGILLIIIGVVMMTGLLGRLLALLAV